MRGTGEGRGRGEGGRWEQAEERGGGGSAEAPKCGQELARGGPRAASGRDARSSTQPPQDTRLPLIAGPTRVVHVRLR